MGITEAHFLAKNAEIRSISKRSYIYNTPDETGYVKMEPLQGQVNVMYSECSHVWDDIPLDYSIFGMNTIGCEYQRSDTTQT